MNVLFLTVSTGSGHIKAAQAIKERVDERFENSKTLIVDTLKYVSPLADKVIVGGYLQTVRGVPQVYGKLYKLAEFDEKLTNFCKSVNRLFSGRLYNLIQSFEPTIVVCTHTVPLHMMSYLKFKGMVNIPVVAVVTDYTSHLFWKHDNIDAFIVAHDYIKHDMMSMGIDEQSVYSFGIPVSKEFLIKKSKQKTLKELKLKDKLTVLLMGGSLGLGGVPEVFRSLINCKRDLQIIAVTGNNAKLKQELHSYSVQSHREVKIFGYTDRIADLMDASDLIITKPGGMTISEALVKELPIIIMSPIPGQEERNAHFLTNCGVAAGITTGENIEGVLCQIIDNPLRLHHMKDMARYLRKLHAAQDISDLLGRLSGVSQISEFPLQASAGNIFRV